MNALPNRSHQTLSQLTTKPLKGLAKTLQSGNTGRCPFNSSKQMNSKRQHFERIKLLTHAGRHIEAQALYEELINRTSSDGGRSGQLIHEN